MAFLLWVWLHWALGDDGESLPCDRCCHRYIVNEWGRDFHEEVGTQQQMIMESLREIQNSPGALTPFTYKFYPPHEKRGGDVSWLADNIFCSPTGSWDQLFTQIPRRPFLLLILSCCSFYALRRQRNKKMACCELSDTVSDRIQDYVVRERMNKKNFPSCWKVEFISPIFWIIKSLQSLYSLLYYLFNDCL